MEHKLSYYITKAKTLEINKSEKSLRIAILSSFTLNGLEETIRVKCSELKINCINYVAGYNQYNQEILDEHSKLYDFLPDIAFLILDIRSVFGKLLYSPYSYSLSERKQFVDKKLEDISNILRVFTKNSKAKLIVSNANIPTYSPYGITETKTDYGIYEMVTDFNSRLSVLIKNMPSVYLYDLNGFITRFGDNNIFDYRQFFLGDIRISFDYIPHLANDLLAYIKPLLGINRKCVVLDLDNTLWGGVVGEDELDGIKLGDSSPGNAFVEFQYRLLSLWERGIILAINSKNNPDDALQVIRDHPNMILREENFACMKINWNDKVTNFKEISNELNIGLNSMVFLDDDPVNREFVRKELPEILTVDLPDDPSHYTRCLMELNDFNVFTITDEDLDRGKMYFEQKQRTDFSKSVSNLDDFLKQLDVKIKIKSADQFTIPRISQLTLKTNQFNLTTYRYQEEEIRKFSQNNDMLIGCAQVEDKFGDNGITGVFIVKKQKDEWDLDTFLLSCRVMGRKVEDGILCHILEKAKTEGVKRIRAKYLPTKKNIPCQNFLSDFGFKKEGDNWIFNLSNTIKIPEHLTVISE